MGLKHLLILSFLFVGIVCAASTTWMVDGTNETYHARPLDNLTALHLKQIGAENVYALRLPSSLQDLNLSSNKLPTLPERFIPPTIRRVWLADNILVELPPEVSQWTALTYLNLDRNRLRQLPDLSKTRLRWLRLNDNRLTTLPPLPESLETLVVQRNQLSTFTHRPSALRQLNLSGNPLTEIPEAVGNGLEWLDLSKTKVKALPANLKGWRTLKVLNLAECPLPESEKDRIEASFDPLHTTILF